MGRGSRRSAPARIPERRLPVTDITPLAHRCYLREVERLVGARRDARPGVVALVACLILAAGPGLLAMAVSGG
jgi:hypothetical protein